MEDTAPATTPAAQETPAAAPAAAAGAGEEGAISAPAQPAKVNERPPNPENAGKPRKLKYRKAYIIFGYTGTGYSGIQRNPNVRAIEDELFEALEKAGLISHGDDLQSRQKLDWTRSARTDKGVHAAANMVGCKLMEPVEGFEVAAARMNEHLPPQVRVYKVQRTVKSFSAQHAAGGRQYEYLLPTFVLKPVHTGHTPLSKPVTMPGLRKGETPPPVVPGNITSDPFASGQAQAAGRSQAWAARAAAGGHCAFTPRPAVARDAAVTAAPSTELWDGAGPAIGTGLPDSRDTRPSNRDHHHAPAPAPAPEVDGDGDVKLAEGAVPASVPAPSVATGAGEGGVTLPAASTTGGVKRAREEGEGEVAGEAGEVSSAKAARTDSGEGEGEAPGPTIVQEERVVLRMTKGWTYDASKYIYLAARVWKGRFQRRATARDLVPDAPRPGTAAYHNPHTAPVAPISYVTPPRPASRGQGSVADLVADPFANGSAGKAAREQVRMVQAAAEGKLLAERQQPTWGLDVATLARLRTAAELMIGTHYYHNFTPKMTAGDAATQRTLYSIKVSEPFMVEATEYVRITLRGQSFILNQIRHMVACMADYARGVMPAFLMGVIFSRNTRMNVPLAPATGLFLHNPEFPYFNQKHGESYGPIVFDEGTPVRELVESFKKEVVYPHMHVQMSGEENPFVEFLDEYRKRTFYRCYYNDTCPTSTHSSKTAMREYVHRSFHNMASELGKGAARATVSAIMGTTNKGARGHLFKSAQGAAQRNKRSRGSGRGRRRW